MRIIKASFLKAAAARHSRAAADLEEWLDVVRLAEWRTPVQMKESLPGIDPVKVKSGHTVYVCNIRRNEFRLIIAVHFDRQVVYALRFFTHAEYDRQNWQNEL